MHYHVAYQNHSKFFKNKGAKDATLRTMCTERKCMMSLFNLLPIISLSVFTLVSTFTIKAEYMNILAPFSRKPPVTYFRESRRNLVGNTVCINVDAIHKLTLFRRIWISWSASDSAWVTEQCHYEWKKPAWEKENAEECPVSSWRSDLRVYTMWMFRKMSRFPSLRDAWSSAFANRYSAYKHH